MNVVFTKNLPNALVPTRATAGSAAYDLHAAEIIVDLQKNTMIIDTGLSTEFNAGHAMLIFGRSGLASKYGLRPINGVGVVDSDYRGPIKVMLRSDTHDIAELLANDYVKIGDRIAQAIFMPITQVTFTEQSRLADSERGVGGFGSTGK